MQHERRHEAPILLFARRTLWAGAGCRLCFRSGSPVQVQYDILWQLMETWSRADLFLHKRITFIPFVRWCSSIQCRTNKSISGHRSLWNLTAQWGLDPPACWNLERKLSWLKSLWLTLADSCIVVLSMRYIKQVLVLGSVLIDFVRPISPSYLETKLEDTVKWPVPPRNWNWGIGSLALFKGLPAPCRETWDFLSGLDKLLVQVVTRLQKYLLYFLYSVFNLLKDWAGG